MNAQDMSDEQYVATLRAGMARRMQNRARRAPGVDQPGTGNNMLSGFARGAAYTGLGLFGDGESLVRGGIGAAQGGLEGAIQGLDEDTFFPSSKSVKERFERMGWDPGQGAKLGEFAGEFVGLSPLASVVRKLRRTLKARKARKPAPELTPQELAPGFFRGGSVGRDELDDMLDQAYMNVKFD